MTDYEEEMLRQMGRMNRFLRTLAHYVQGLNEEPGDAAEPEKENRSEEGR